MSAVKAELVRSIEHQAGMSESALGQKMLRKVRSVRSLLVASDKFWEDGFIDDHAPDFSRLTHSEVSDSVDDVYVQCSMRALGLLTYCENFGSLVPLLFSFT